MATTEYHKIQTVWQRDDKGIIQPGMFSVPEFDYLMKNEWEWTEKVDGTNIRVMYRPEEQQKVVLGGKTDNAQIPSDLIKHLQKQFQQDYALQTFADRFDSEVTIYGEGYGPKIQKGGGRYASSASFAIFDVKVGDWWLKRSDVEAVADYFCCIAVPIVGHGTLLEACDYTSRGFNSAWGDFTAEGLVMRPKVALFNRKGERVIAKIKHIDYTRLNALVERDE